MLTKGHGPTQCVILGFFLLCGQLLCSPGQPRGGWRWMLHEVEGHMETPQSPDMVFFAEVAGGS